MTKKEQGMDEQKEQRESELVYTDPEVAEIMTLLAQIYAIDDAIYNQTRMERPPGYIKPLHDIRAFVSGRMKYLTSKTNINQEVNSQNP